MELSDNAKIIEVILFVENQPLSSEKLARMSKIKEEKVLEALSQLKAKYDEGHGLCLETSEEGYSFTARPELFDKLRKTYGKRVNTRLTRAALETLAIIAYSQPISRPSIDDIRGVSSEGIIKILRERELIKVVGRGSVGNEDKAPGNPCLYGTTKKFLYEFNLNSIQDLPKMNPQDSERYEEKDSSGNVLHGNSRLIKKHKKAEEESMSALQDTEHQEEDNNESLL